MTVLFNKSTNSSTFPLQNLRLRYNVPVGIEKDGTLRFRHPSDKGYFSQSAPKAWQDINGKRTQVEVAFADYGDNTIGFRLGEYNRQYPVVIDPTYSWHTFYGSAGATDIGFDITVDTSGNAYVCGVSDATWNGPGAVAPLNAYSGGNDIVVLKLSDPAAAANVAVPTMNEWGMIIFMLLAGLGSIHYMRRRRT